MLRQLPWVFFFGGPSSFSFPFSLLLFFLGGGLPSKTRVLRTVLHVYANVSNPYSRARLCIERYSPLAGGRLLKTNTSFPIGNELAKKYNWSSAAQLGLAWIAQRGLPVVTKSSNPDYLSEDLQLFGPTHAISVADRQRIDALSTPNCIEEAPGGCCHASQPSPLLASTEASATPPRAPAVGLQAFYILFAEQVTSVDWPNKICQNAGRGPQGSECVTPDTYKNGVFIASPQNMTKDLIAKVKKDVPGSRVVAYVMSSCAW